jgi:hypothetical protein
LHPDDLSLKREPYSGSGHVTYKGLSDGVTYISSPLDNNTEITGPIAAKLFVSSSTKDADLFLIVRVFTADFKEVTFQGALDPHTPIAQGWLRASHRKLDADLSEPYCPYHSHDEIQLLDPGEIYECDIEVWPTCIVIPAGFRIGLSVRGRDYEWPGGTTKGLGTHDATFTGVGPFKHNDPRDRQASIFGGNVTLHCTENQQPYLLLPIIP